jgi:hypothetical protein
MLARRLLGHFANTLMLLYFFEYRLQFVYKRFAQTVVQTIGFQPFVRTNESSAPESGGQINLHRGH